jgi:hypothetical protein
MAEKLLANIEKRARDGKTKQILLRALNDTFFWQFWTAGSLKVPPRRSSLTLVARGYYQRVFPASHESFDKLRQPSV